MKIPYANKFSWFPINYHFNVDSQKLERINLGKDVQVRYDLKKGELVVVRARFIEKTVKGKLDKISEIKSKFLIKSNDLQEVKSFYNNRKDLIINILQ